MLRDALIERMREARIKVNTHVAEGEFFLSKLIGNTRMMAVDRTTDEYKQKVSDAEQRIEKRLAELNRSMTEEQSPKSIIGNSDGSMPVGTSSVIDEGIVSRAQSVALSGVKINKKFQTSKDLEKTLLYLSPIWMETHTPEEIEKFKKLMQGYL